MFNTSGFFIFYTLPFLQKGFFLNDPITLIAPIYILNFHCAVIRSYLNGEICGPHGYFNVMSFIL